jgi:hypothetical protein
VVEAKRELMAVEEERFAAERRRAEEARRHEDELAAQCLEAELARARRKAEADRERAQIDLARREAGETDATLLGCAARPTTISQSPGFAKSCSPRRCPELARAFRGTFDRVHVTSTNTSDPFGFLTAGIDHVLASVREGKMREK